MDNLVWPILGFSIIPYSFAVTLSDSESKYTATSTRMAYVFYIAAFAWILLYIPCNTALSITFSLFDVLITNICMLLQTDLLFVQSKYSFSIYSFVQWNLVIAILTTTTYALIDYSIITLPSSREQADENQDNTFVDNLTMFIALSGVISVAIIGILRQYVNKKHLHARYSNLVISIIVTLTCVSTLMLKLLPAIWSLIFHRVFTWLSLYIAIVCRKHSAIAYFAPIRKLANDGIVVADTNSVSPILISTLNKPVCIISCDQYIDVLPCPEYRGSVEHLRLL